MHLKLEEKHKVTIYLTQELHRKLKIRAAMEEEPMSTLAERALDFYLEHGDLVEERIGQAYRLYECPSCEASLVLREGELNPVPDTAAVLFEDEATLAVPDAAVLSCR